MRRNRKVEEFVVYLLAIIGGTRLLPAGAPVIMVSNTCKYVNGNLWVTCKQSEDDIVSGMSSLVYVTTFFTIIVRIMFFTSNVETDLDLPSMGADGDGQAVGSRPELASILTKFLFYTC